MKYLPYKSYKNSGIEWMGDIPESWVMKKLKFTANIFASNVDKKTVDGQSLVSLCNYTDVYYNEIIKSGMDFMVASATNEQIEKFLLKKNDVIITKDSETPDDIGIAAYVPEDIPGVICGYHLSMIRPKRNNSGAFIKRVFDSHYVKSKFETLANGVTRYGLGSYAIDNLSIPLPPYEEQKAIANFLDRETAKIDELIQRQESLVDLYGERINALVLDGLASLETKYIRLMHVSDVISRPLSQEDGCSYKPLGLYNRGRGIFIKEERESKDMGDSDFFWIESGDLIFSGQFAWEGAVAMAHPEHDGCVVSHRYPVIRGKEGVALTEYLLALFQTSHGDFLLNENSRGAAGRNRPLNMSLLLKEKIPIIDMQSQLKIKRLIESKELFLKKSAQEIAFLKEHRASLISAVVTGKIDVRESV